MNFDIAELALGGGSIAVGFLSCFFGARYFRPVLSLTGFIIGLFIGITIVAANNAPVNGIPPIGLGGIALGVGIGLVLALVLYFLFDWSVIIAGAFLGVAAGFFVINLLNTPVNSTTSFIVIAVCAVIGAGVGYAVRRLIVVLGTAFNGAMLMVYGLSIFIPSIGFVIRFRDLDQTRTTTLASLLILGLGALGAFVQWNITGKNLKKR